MCRRCCVRRRREKNAGITPLCGEWVDIERRWRERDEVFQLAGARREWSRVPWWYSRVCTVIVMIIPRLSGYSSTSSPPSPPETSCTDDIGHGVCMVTIMPERVGPLDGELRKLSHSGRYAPCVLLSAGSDDGLSIIHTCNETFGA